MPDLTGIPALDVFIGMAFLFFLLSTACASVNEVIQTVLNARARTLVKGVKTLINDDAKATDFINEWQLRRLGKPAGAVRTWWKTKVRKKDAPAGRLPSYIPARSFALAVLETATRGEGEQIGTDLYAEAKATVDKLGPEAIRGELSAGLTDAQGEIDALRIELERRFDDAMDRVSGWYKRYVQWWLLAIALTLSVAMNVDSFRVGERLFKDDTLRAAVVQQAQKSVADKPTGTQPTDPEQVTPMDVADQIDEIHQLGLPIGWSDANTEGPFLGRLAGWLVTAFALSLGAPFWFDVLGKAARLRNAGNREGTAKDNDRAAEDRDDPSGRRFALGA